MIKFGSKESFTLSKRKNYITPFAKKFLPKACFLDIIGLFCDLIHCLDSIHIILTCVLLRDT